MVGPILGFFILMLAWALNERMQRKLDYTQEAVRVLKETIKDLNGGKRICFTVGQRRRLAILGKDMTPKERQEVELDRHARHNPQVVSKSCGQEIRRLAQAGALADHAPPKETRDLIIELAEPNPGCGYTRIRDALRGLGIAIARSTIADILKDAPLGARARTK